MVFQAMLLALLLALAGCGDAETEARAAAAGLQQRPYRIVATTGMIADIAREVAGDRAAVEGLIGSGVDPHLYKPTRSDVVALQGADVVFYNGLLLEGKMTDVLERIAETGKPIVAVTDGIAEQGDYVITTAAHHDPHVWMDVTGWSGAVDVVARTVSAYDPEHAAEYASRAEAYQAQLAELDSYARQTIASIPERQRVLVTAHDAFNYLGRAYGIAVRGIQGLSTESEAGVQDIERLVRFLVERQIPAVFVETSVADKNVRALVEGAHAQGHDVRIGGSLFSDAMGPAGTYEGTYIGMIDHNVTTIARALGGNAPQRGMQGKLADHP